MSELQGWTEEEAQRTIGEIVGRATTDAEFRKLCLDNPRAAIAQVNPRPIPGDYTIQFVDNEGNDLTVVLPDMVSEEGELSDSELEEVAGGGTANRCGGSCAASCVFSAVL